MPGPLASGSHCSTVRTLCMVDPPLNSRGPCPAMLYDLNVSFCPCTIRMWVTLSTRSAAAAALLLVVLLSCSAVGAEASRRSSRVSRISPNSTIGKGTLLLIFVPQYLCQIYFQYKGFTFAQGRVLKYLKKLGGDERQF